MGVDITTSSGGSFGSDPVEAGLERARRYDIDMSRDEIGEDLDALRRVLDRWTGELSDRFVELLVENVTVASAARRHYADAPLDDGTIEAFVEYSVAFFNSWRHR